MVLIFFKKNWSFCWRPHSNLVLLFLQIWFGLNGLLDLNLIFRLLIMHVPLCVFSDPRYEEQPQLRMISIMIICNFAAAGNNVLYKVICCAWRLSTQCHSIICTIHVMESNEGIFSLKYNLLSRSTWFWICYLFYLFLFSALLWWSNGCVYNKKPSKLCWCRPKQSCTWCCGNQLDTQGKCFLPGKTCIDFFFLHFLFYLIFIQIMYDYNQAC